MRMGVRLSHERRWRPFVRLHRLSLAGLVAWMRQEAVCDGLIAVSISIDAAAVAATDAWEMSEGTSEVRQGGGGYDEIGWKLSTGCWTPSFIHSCLPSVPLSVSCTFPFSSSSLSATSYCCFSSSSALCLPSHQHTSGFLDIERMATQRDWAQHN
eukprot:GHVU01015683.1.p1 GENE.GHVU01015683.1~~GHVU01015683.1.p1  ORF type:complete len:155 (+),score=9.01 GHVU01015683.1:286-750(+)